MAPARGLSPPLIIYPRSQVLPFFSSSLHLVRSHFLYTSITMQNPSIVYVFRYYIFRTSPAQLPTTSPLLTKALLSPKSLPSFPMRSSAAQPHGTCPSRRMPISNFTVRVHIIAKKAIPRSFTCSSVSYRCLHDIPRCFQLIGPHFLVSSQFFSPFFLQALTLVVLGSSPIFSLCEPSLAVFGWNVSGLIFFGFSISVRIALVWSVKAFLTTLHAPVGAVTVTTNLPRAMCTPQGKGMAFPRR